MSEEGGVVLTVLVSKVIRATTHLRAGRGNHPKAKRVDNRVTVKKSFINGKGAYCIYVGYHINLTIFLDTKI